MEKVQYQRPFIKVRLIDSIDLLSSSDPSSGVPFDGSGRAGDGDTPLSKHQGSFLDGDKDEDGNNSSLWSN